MTVAGRAAAVTVAGRAAAVTVAGRAAAVTVAGRAAACVCSVGPCQKEIMLYDTVLCEVTVQLIQTTHRERSCVCCLHTLPTISVNRNVFLLVTAIHLVHFMEHKSFVIIRVKQDQCYH